MSISYRFSAMGALLKRYSLVTRHFWKQRHKMTSGIFTQDEAEFLPGTLSIQEHPDSPTLKLTSRLLMLLVLLAMIWSVFGKLDIVVNASGKIVSSSRTKSIVPVETASVKAIHVSEGQHVRAGELLIELDSSSSDAEFEKAASSAAQARLQIARAQSLIDSIRQHRAPVLVPINEVKSAQWHDANQQLQTEYLNYTAQKDQFEAALKHYSALLPLVTRRAEDYHALLSNGDVAYHSWIEKEQERMELTGKITDAKNQLAALMEKTLKETYDLLQEGNRVLSASKEDMARNAQHSHLLKLTSPVDGTVQQLIAHTTGAAVPAAQPLMQIVPSDNQVEVEAFMENKDIGFVHEGQIAAVKIDAFDYSKYGSIQGVIKHVSRDAIQDEKRGLLYALKVVLDTNNLVVDGKTVPLSAGMSVEVEIKTGKRRVIEYVLSPLQKTSHEALNER